MAEKMTPMMQQYCEIKKKYQHCILFYRLGDFYEMFFDDAVFASKELNLTLTGKDCGMESRAPMCGVPFHSADVYIAKLVEKGYKVAICEQVEDPKKAKGLVKRDVIRVVTPGTLLDTNALDESKNNYLMCIYSDEKGFGIAVTDVTTGDLVVSEFKANEDNKVIDTVAMYRPAEIIVNEGAYIKFTDRILKIFDIQVMLYGDWAFKRQYCDVFLCNHFKVINLNGFGIGDSKYCIIAAGAIMSYLVDAQKGKAGIILGIRKYDPMDYMILDISSRKNLELTESIHEKSKKGSLLWVLDKTKTAMGARTLRRWIEQPLIDLNKIDRRLAAVEQTKNNVFAREELKELLADVYDIERLMSKVSYATANAKDLVALKNSFEKLPEIKRVAAEFDCEYFDKIKNDMDTLDDIYNLLDSAISDDPPFSVREGGIIKEGYNDEVDQLRAAKTEGAKWLSDLELREKEATGIKKLKIGFNKVFGYYIEVTNSFKDLVPDSYIRKQTLANCERYITSELKDIEEKILGADDKVVVLEYDLFCEVRNLVASKIERISETAKSISEIDVLQSLGDVAEKNNYVRPVVKNNGVLQIKNGRHPVVEAISKEEFIPNDTYLDLEKDTVAIITGPNMAGKSTYMRQTALIVIMAQIGSFVPADAANIGITDRIFTRVGASDDLATGQSTFMIEMTEVANILNNATRSSLLILDEVGRGTSTYDGLSIAWAVIEYISKRIAARTLFATHYHEITELADEFENITNYCVRVKEDGEDVIFLRKIIEGKADKSYGLHVAKLAGVPNRVVKRANQILKDLDKEKAEISSLELDYSDEYELDSKYEEIGKIIENTDVESITPLEALKLIDKCKSMLDVKY